MIAKLLLQEPLHRENQLRVKKIFVGGLKETTDDNLLTEYFTQFGKVDHVDLIEDRNTKRTRGFAYVTFNDYDPVDKAVCKYNDFDPECSNLVFHCRLMPYLGRGISSHLYSTLMSFSETLSCLSEMEQHSFQDFVMYLFVQE